MAETKKQREFVLIQEQQKVMNEDVYSLMINQ
jgi:hypothetical protein